MCLVALALGLSRRFPCVLASNRDEFYARPSAPLAWWTSAPGTAPILGGRDLQAGGTWLGATAAGRLALVTNLRDPLRHDPAARSRGLLVPRWLLGDDDAPTFWAAVEPARYNGFNLLAADLPRGTWHWASNAGAGEPRPLGPGVYGLSNAALDTPWPKTERLKTRLRSALAIADAEPDDAAAVDVLTRQLFAALADTTTAADADLPATGVPLALERALSAAFIRTADGRYGTRCSTLVIARRRGAALHHQMLERSHDGAAAVTRSMRID